MPGDPFYRSAAWLEARSAYLAQHPRCEVPSCGKRSSHVDHKLSRRKGGASLDPRNFMALCHSHHSEKTVRKDGGWGRKPGAMTFKGCDVNGRPIDPGHPWRGGGQKTGSDRGLDRPGSSNFAGAEIRRGGLDRPEGAS